MEPRYNKRLKAAHIIDSLAKCCLLHILWKFSWWHIL